MKRFEGKLVVVTGAAQGIGQGIAKRFVEEGATVIVAGRTFEKVEAAAKEMDAVRAIPFQMDVAKAEDWKKLVAYIKENFGSLDVLVNNAAITNSPSLMILDGNDDAFDRILKTNVYGIYYGMKYCYEVIKKGVYAGYVNIGSFAGLSLNKGTGNDVAYQTSKFAVRQLSKHAALNMAADCVRVNIVHPGGSMTPMVKAWLESEGLDSTAMAGNNPMPPHYVLPEEVAEAVMFLADPQTARGITGAEIAVDSAASLV